MNNLTVQNINGRLYVDSREVAAMVGKTHNNLLRDIKNYKETLDNANFEDKSNLISPNFFVSATYKNSQNRDMPCFLLTKKGCDMVANKMTGTKGILFTAAYVTKFEEMEKQLSQPKLSDEQIKAQLLLNIYNGGQEGILASKQLTELEVKEATKQLVEEVEHKEDVIIGLVKDITVAEKRQRISQIVKRNAKGKFQERYNLLYSEFDKKYHVDTKRRLENAKARRETIQSTNRMDYICDTMNMTNELYEIACKIFENDFEDLKKEMWDIIA